MSSGRLRRCMLQKEVGAEATQIPSTDQNPSSISESKFDLFKNPSSSRADNIAHLAEYSASTHKALPPSALHRTRHGSTHHLQLLSEQDQSEIHEALFLTHPQLSQNTKPLDKKLRTNKSTSPAPPPLSNRDNVACDLTLNWGLSAST